MPHNYWEICRTSAHAHRFCEKLGCQRIGTRQFAVGSPVVDDCVMGLLPDPPKGSPTVSPVDAGMLEVLEYAHLKIRAPSD